MQISLSGLTDRLIDILPRGNGNRRRSYYESWGRGYEPDNKVDPRNLSLLIDGNRGADGGGDGVRDEEGAQGGGLQVIDRENYRKGGRSERSRKMSGRNRRGAARNDNYFPAVTTIRNRHVFEGV